MKTKFLFAVLAVFAFAGAVAAQENAIKKVAILETVNKEGDISYGVRLMLRSQLSYAITNTAGYEGYDRVDMSSIMDEHNFQRTGLVNDEQIKQLGEMTGAAYILVAEVASVDARNIFITAKILEVETALLVKTANVQSGTDARNIEMNCRLLALELFGEDGSAESDRKKISSIFRNDVSPRSEKPEAKEDSRTASDAIMPGMKYREYRKYYSASDYSRMPGDKYSPFWAGFESAFVPGLGQMLSDELGRGFAFLGGEIACLGLVCAAEFVDSEEAYVIMSLVASVGLAGLHLWNIFDAAKVAKIKNMYYQDLGRARPVELSLQPYISSTPSSAVVAGATFRVRF